MTMHTRMRAAPSSFVRNQVWNEPKKKLKKAKTRRPKCRSCPRQPIRNIRTGNIQIRISSLSIMS